MQAETEIILTARGLKKIEDELDQFRTVHRKRVADRIRDSKHFGELTDNSEFEDAKNEQAYVEGRIDLDGSAADIMELAWRLAEAGAGTYLASS